MQTIKTAAVVVLMMTVIYGAYISLTTPPEPLPADVEDMLVMSDESGMSMESTLPPSLAELGISSGTTLGEPEIQPGGTSQTANPGMFAGQNDIQSNPSFDAAPELPTSGVPVEFVSAGLPSNSAAGSPAVGANASSPDSGFQTTFSDEETDSVKQPPTSGYQTSGDPTSGYQSTNQTFQMPDPSAIRAADLARPGSNAPAQASSGNIVQNAAMSTDGFGSADVSQVAAIGNTKPNLGLANAIRTADRQFASDQRREALSTLSIFYSVPDLSGEQRSELLSRLDPLAAAVIYSGEHLLERPYRVARNETLMEIADRYEVPWQLLANINQVTDPVTIIPGTELKVVRGPFRAEVDLSANELTLFLGDLYAGRFPIGVGSDPAPKTGTFTVQDKQTSRTFYDRSGAAVAPGSQQNPYGNAWIDLGGQMCIHGSPSTSEPSQQGCISLAADFADDLYGILSQGSTVVIKN